MDRGGVETWLVQVLRHMDPSRVRMDFLVHTDRECAYDGEVQSLGARIFHCSGHRNLPSYARRFRRILAEYGPFDVVHSHVHHFSGFVLWLAQRACVRSRVAHSHSDTRAAYGNAPAMRRPYLKLAQRLVLRCATSGLAASREAAAALFGRDWERDGRWRVLYCGIDLRPFENSTPDPFVRAELSIPEDTFVLGHIGGFRAEKNHAFLIDILQATRALEPRAHLLLVGDGPLRNAVAGAVQTAGLSRAVVFAGERSDVARLLTHAIDVTLLPSFREGLPLVALESQAAGIPVILSDVVTREVDLVPALVERLSLQDPPRLWAQRALARHPQLVDRGAALRTVADSPFAVRRSTEFLTSHYDRVRPTAAPSMAADTPTWTSR